MESSNEIYEMVMGTGTTAVKRKFNIDELMQLKVINERSIVEMIDSSTDESEEEERCIVEVIDSSTDESEEEERWILEAGDLSTDDSQKLPFVRNRMRSQRNIERQSVKINNRSTDNSRKLAMKQRRTQDKNEQYTRTRNLELEPFVEVNNWFTYNEAKSLTQISPIQNQGVKRKIPTKSKQSAMRPVRPGLTGLVNLGNTCYMNSIIQCLSNVAEFCDYYRAGYYKEHLDQ